MGMEWHEIGGCSILSMPIYHYECVSSTHRLQYQGPSLLVIDSKTNMVHFLDFFGTDGFLGATFSHLVVSNDVLSGDLVFLTNHCCNAL